MESYTMAKTLFKLINNCLQTINHHLELLPMLKYLANFIVFTNQTVFNFIFVKFQETNHINSWKLLSIYYENLILVTSLMILHFKKTSLSDHIIGLVDILCNGNHLHAHLSMVIFKSRNVAKIESKFRYQSSSNYKFSNG